MTGDPPADSEFSRRAFLAGSLLSIAGIEQVGSPPRSKDEPQGQDITPATIAEAEKIHALESSAETRSRLARTIPGQVAAVQAVRAIAKPRELAPGVVFDPRLPGATYRHQPNSVRLGPDRVPKLPRDDREIAFAPVVWLSEWLRTRQITSRRLTDIYLERIERIGPKLLCWITVTADLARRQADQADREIRAGRYRGALHGVPYGIKDLFDTANVPTTWGAAPFRTRVPTSNAAVVTSLERAGAVLLGKLATGALANGATWFGGQCRNPWNPDEPAGGSSTGSGSATAAALCGFSIGTDSLGSILNPADRCGVTGLRATFGRISTAGAMPLTPSLDRIGPLTRAVEDTALVMAVINGPDRTSPTSIEWGFEYRGDYPIRQLRVGYSPKWFEQIGFPGASVPASAAHHAALEALKSLGVETVLIDLPERPYYALINNLMVEAAAIFEDLTLDGRDRDLPVDNDSAWPDSWRQARFLSAVDYLQFERLRRQVMVDFHQIFQRVDALFGPTYGNFELLMAANFTGHPGLSMRAGISESATRGLGPNALDPTGPKHTITQNVAFHGQLFEEGRLIALGRALEERLDVNRHRPAVD